MLLHSPQAEGLISIITSFYSVLKEQDRNIVTLLILQEPENTQKLGPLEAFSFI